MTLPERIDSDLKDAMRAKDAMRLGVLRMLKSALKYSALEKAGSDRQLDDAEAAQVIRKQVKQRQDSIESFEKGGRPELAAKEKAELAILNAYLPKGLEVEELFLNKIEHDRRLIEIGRERNELYFDEPNLGL